MNAIDWLAVTTGITALLWVPYVLDRMVVQGIWGALDNPRAEPPLHPWAQRAAAAHRNALENLVLMGLAVLAAALRDRADDPGVVMAVQLYLALRLVHYGVYAAGIPVLRTLAFVGGWAATLFVLAQVLA